jgi:hypothetical protein
MPTRPLGEYAYAFTDDPDDAILEILGPLPNRWGRMPPLARAVVVETGRFLIKIGISSPIEAGQMIGLMGGTRRGSLVPDLDYADTLNQGTGLASPALFGYTLANIPLAEAAGHYHLTGPVYAIFDETSPLNAAVCEAERLVRMNPGLDSIIACSFDHYRREGKEQLSLAFAHVQKNG